MVKLKIELGDTNHGRPAESYNQRMLRNNRDPVYWEAVRTFADSDAEIQTLLETQETDYIIVDSDELGYIENVDRLLKERDFITKCSS